MIYVDHPPNAIIATYQYILLHTDSLLPLISSLRHSLILITSNFNYHSSSIISPCAFTTSSLHHVDYLIFPRVSIPPSIPFLIHYFVNYSNTMHTAQEMCHPCLHFTSLSIGKDPEFHWHMLRLSVHLSLANLPNSANFLHLSSLKVNCWNMPKTCQRERQHRNP